MLKLSEFVQDFASGLKKVDADAPQGRSKTRLYQPGVGPLMEQEAIKKVVEYLKSKKTGAYCSATSGRYPGTRSQCDLILPTEWAFEFKLIRPFYDNGKEAEHWSENLLHPYPGNVSAVGDCLKLAQSDFEERKAVIVFAYEHAEPKINLALALDAFELIARNLWSLKLSARISAGCKDLIHPHHQCAQVYGWEIFSSTPEEKALQSLRSLPQTKALEVARKTSEHPKN